MKKILSISLVLMLSLASCSSNESAQSVEKNEKVVETSEKVTNELGDLLSEDYQMPKNDLGPMASIKDLDQKLESYHLGQKLTEEQLKENKELKRSIVRGTFDIRELCRLSLSKHWKKIEPEQQKRFVAIMTKLLEKKAIFSQEKLSGDNKYYQIRYLSEQFLGELKDQSVVKTQMNIPKKKIELGITYKMVKGDRGWKIYDVIVDEASLLNNYKFQFDRIIKKEGYEALVERMEKKLESA
jgi:phospholipid transport system substrate-binding protein